MTQMPQSLEVESSLLGVMLFAPSTIEKVLDELKENNFYDKRHRILFKTINSMVLKDIDVDTITLANELKDIGELEQIGGITYLVELSNSVFTAANVDNYIKIIKEKFQRRQIIKLANDLLVQASDPQEDILKIISSAENEMYKIVTNDINDSMCSMSECVEDTLIKIEERVKNGGGLTGIPTGIVPLDNRTGGLQKGELTIVAARPSMGKTAFALNIAQNSSKNSNVAVFSIEMPKHQLVDRMLANIASIELGKIRTGILKDDEWNRIAIGSSQLASRNIKIDDSGAITVSKIKSQCRKLKVKGGLDVVVIDYLQIISIEKENLHKSREQQISGISSELKKMAKDLDVAVVCLSQLSRAPEQRADHRPMLSDLRESGSIEQDADTIMMLYRDDYYNKASEDAGIAECIIAKQRNGEVGTIKLAWVPQNQKFKNIFI